MILGLEDIDPGSERTVGGKAANLARLLRLGFFVPPGFCITGTAYRDHMNAHGLWARARWALESEPGSLARSLAQLRHAIAKAPLDESLAAAIQEGYAGLGAPHVAVRSSATAEDMPEHSFAGQHGTYFVSDPLSCLERVKHCWASLWTERAVAYRRRADVRHSDVDMAVIIQALVDAEAAGVAFTADPVAKARDRIVVEACLGMGETLVSGKVNPDRIVLARPSLKVLERTIAEKGLRVVLGPGGGGVEEAVPDKQAREPALDDAQVRRVAELALSAERELGAPQDLEWALVDGAVFVIQSRPITTLGGRTDAHAPSLVGGRGGSVDPARLVWSNVNTGEVLPDVASPMTWSVTAVIITQIFEATFGRLGIHLGDAPLMRLIGGRAYFCLNTFVGVLSSVPGFRGRDMTEVFGGEQARFEKAGAYEIRPEDVPEVRAGGLAVLLRLPGTFGLMLSHSPRRGLAYAERMRVMVEGLQRQDLASLTEAELVARLEELTASKGESDYRDMITYALSGIVHFHNLTRLTRRWLGDAHGVVANTLVSGAGDMESAESGLGLWRLAVAARDRPEVAAAIRAGAPESSAARPRDAGEALLARLATVEGGAGFVDEWHAFMGRHGHHTRAEIDVRNPRWSETPEYVLDVIRGYLEGMEQGMPDPVEAHAMRAGEAERVAASCRRELGPVRRAVFDWTLARARMGSVVRENVKSEAIRWIDAIRRNVLELGDRLTARGVIRGRDDIFFLSLDEVGPVSAGMVEFDVRRTTAERRTEFERNLTLEPPPVVVGDWDPARAPRVPAREPSRVFEGLSVSAGHARGPARVILRGDDGQQVLPGEILVAPFTDPGWTPYFLPAAGIVMDMGGMLSHGSIVAREYGIPAVVNVGPATKLIRTGQLVEVDADHGVVRVLDVDEGPAAPVPEAGTDLAPPAPEAGA